MPMNFASLLTPLIPALVLIPVLVFIRLFVIYRQRQISRRNRRSPLTGRMLRGPGESLRAQIAASEPDIVLLMAMVFVIPLIGFSVHVSQSHFGGLPDSWSRTGATLVLVAVADWFIARKQLRMLEQRRKKMCLEWNLLATSTA